METEVQEINIEINEAREWVERAEALERLSDNEDFKLLISEGYFKEEAARIVGLKADPQFIFAGKEQMKFLNVLETGVGALQQYFRQIRMQGRAATESLSDMEDTREEIYQEALQ